MSNEESKPHLQGNATPPPVPLTTTVKKEPECPEIETIECPDTITVVFDVKRKIRYTGYRTDYLTGSMEVPLSVFSDAAHERDEEEFVGKWIAKNYKCFHVTCQASEDSGEFDDVSTDAEKITGVKPVKMGTIPIVPLTRGINPNDKKQTP